MSDVTRILSAIERGEPEAADQLLPVVYGELRRLASIKLCNEKPGQTLQPTALVHEAYLRLLGPENSRVADPVLWNGRAHFFAAAAEAMRRILIEKARREQRIRHGGAFQRRASSELQSVSDFRDLPQDERLLAVDDALNRLLEERPLIGQLVRLRYFAGLTIDQSAKALGISPRTAKRYWVFAKAWLRKALDEPLCDTPTEHRE